MTEKNWQTLLAERSEALDALAAADSHFLEEDDALRVLYIFAGRPALVTGTEALRDLQE